MNYAEVRDQLLDGYQPEGTISLAFAGCHIQVSSNARTLLDELGNYFGGYLATDDQPSIILELNEASPAEPTLPLSHWPRPKESRPKEAYADLEDARLIQKTRTGLLFLQGLDRGVATGPLVSNVNQVINFINNQTISHWKRNGWEICHAAALAGPRGLVAFAGLSGGGKSTLTLHLMNAGPYKFVSNDRLLIRRVGNEVHAKGVAKMPRVNPGTLLNNPALVDVLPDQRRRALATLSEDELWALEEKYDAPMAEIFGGHRIQDEGVLNALVILTWNRGLQTVPEMRQCSVQNSAEVLHPIMKGPGPFHADAAGNFLAADAAVTSEPYAQTLAETAVYDLHGGVDFSKAVQLCRPLLDG